MARNHFALPSDVCASVQLEARAGALPTLNIQVSRWALALVYWRITGANAHRLIVTPLVFDRNKALVFSCRGGVPMARVLRVTSSIVSASFESAQSRWTFGSRDVIRTSVLGLVTLVLSCPSTAIGQETATQSVYVQRMMSLDRNADGRLSKDELPGKLGELLTKHDRNGDGHLTPAELSAMETAAVSSRDDRSASEKSEPPAGRRGRGRGPRGGAGTQRGSPLDAAQILKFALTFDRDGDGGLNSSELKTYAAALAGRRAEAKARREAEGNGTPDGSKNSSQPNLRSGSTPNKATKPKGLGADGSGGGGFGDTPPKRP